MSLGQYHSLQSKCGLNIPVIYEDNHLLVVNKPAGLLVQGDITGDMNLLSICKKYLKNKYNKPGNVYLGLIHRIDRPVSGTVVLARTSKAAARLSAQIRERRVEKRYLAIVQGVVPEAGEWIDSISRKGSQAYLDSNKGKSAKLNFKKLSCVDNSSIVEIRLITGRHHQIRVQFSSRGFPIVGDFRYGCKLPFENRSIALHSMSFRCEHPTIKDERTFSSYPNETWPAQYIKQLQGYT